MEELEEGIVSALLSDEETWVYGGSSYGRVGGSSYGGPPSSELDGGPPLFTAEEYGGEWEKEGDSDGEDEKLVEAEKVEDSEDYVILGRGNNDCGELVLCEKEKNMGIITEEISGNCESEIQKSNGGVEEKTGGVIKKFSFLVSEFGLKKYEKGVCSLVRRRLKRPNLMGGFNKKETLRKRAKRSKNRSKRQKRNQHDEISISDEFENSGSHAENSCNGGLGDQEESARILESVERHSPNNTNLSVSTHSWKGAYDAMKANRLWEISKYKLRVSGADKDDAYVERINNIERQDQDAKCRKEKKSIVT